MTSAIRAERHMKQTYLIRSLALAAAFVIAGIRYLSDSETFEPSSIVYIQYLIPSEFDINSHGIVPETLYFVSSFGIFVIVIADPKY